MFDMCTVLAKRAERQAEVRALKAAIEARRAVRPTRHAREKRAAAAARADLPDSRSFA
jgi:hypothetical protein